MNKRMILRVVGRILQIEAALLLPSLLFSLFYREGEWYKFLVPMLCVFALGFGLTLVRPRTKTVYARDGFCIVGASWVLLSLVGAIPLFWSGHFPTFWDALFESVAGFTTTGASVLAEPQVLSHGMQLWRCLSLWLGGMGVLVFVLAFLPLAGGSEMHLLRAELPGPGVGKLRPRMASSAKFLYILYAGMTLLLFAFLLFGKMPWFDALCYALGTAGTGGFTVHSERFAIYANLVYIEWVIGIFMLLFGVNFHIYFLVLLRRCKEAWKSEELRWYLAIFAVSAVLLCMQIFKEYGVFGTSLRQAFFQTSAMLSTTGLPVADYALWPSFSRQLLLTLMCIGGCAGGTAGGFKISRLVMLGKSIRNACKRMLHPRAVQPLRMDGKRIDAETESGVQLYLCAYACILVSCILLVSLNGYDMETNISAVVASFNNIGFGFGRVGPVGNYAFFAVPVKLLLCFVMLLGRLEIFPLLLLCAPRTWRKNA